MPKLIVGLGNPGQNYAANRHNVGFQCLDTFARGHGIAFSQRLRLALVGQGEVAGVSVTLAKPRTYMNLSGRAVTSLLNQLRLRPDDLIVIHDDLDLPLGQIRLRPRGGSGGHKGMQSIIQALGSQEFVRLRVGIDRPAGDDVMDYVLGNFSADERPLVEAARQQVAEALLCLLAEGLERAMNRFN